MNPNPFGRLGIDIAQPVVAEPDSTPVEPAAPVREVAIIGSGPAGYTAAIYCARNGLAPVCVEGSVDRGGALMNTSAVDNFPGFPEGVLGPDLMAGMRAQAERFGAEFVTDDAVAVELGAEPKEIKTAESGTLRARTVILAMGSGHRKLGLPAEERLSGKGVSWCATCDGFFFKGKDIAVVGGGDSAAEEATFLTRFANSVSLIHRRDRLRASHVMADRVARNPKTVPAPAAHSQFGSAGFEANTGDPFLQPAGHDANVVAVVGSDGHGAVTLRRPRRARAAPRAG